MIYYNQVERANTEKEKKMETTRKETNTQNGQEQAEKELDKFIIETSKDNSTKWITYSVRPKGGWGNFIEEIYIHDRKPQSTNTHGAEECYRHYGGFFKNGKVIKPSPSFMKRFHFCPMSR